jgi:hypothetical protein
MNENGASKDIGFSHNSLIFTRSVYGCRNPINTVTKLLVDVGRACEKFHNEKVVGIKFRRIQADEIWSFVYAKEKNKPENVEGVVLTGRHWVLVRIQCDETLAT